MANHGGKMKSVSINGVKMYTISSHLRSVAAWISLKKQRSLRKDKNHTERVELIQDLRFETATSKIKITPDGEFLIASGIYPPQVKVYELRQFSMKFERHLESEIIDFQVLADDYSKLAFLCADRSVNLHAKYGKHYSLRIPRMGRDIAYDCWSCDLLCAASSPDLYRINLEQGRFLSSLNTQSPALNVVSRSMLHGLVVCGGEDGAVECFDMRMRSSIGRINAVSPAGDADEEVTAIDFDENGGFLMGVGSSAGKVLIYDLRSSSPIRVKDHMYGKPILDIKWHSTLNFERPKLITTDCHIVKIWDPETGEGMTSIEPTAGAINDICVFNDSGLMLLALDSSQIPAYFIPALGPVPKWCSSLESLTEELEEGGQTSIYDNYKFLTKEELEKLNLTNLIGTNLLRAYMHGFFIDYRLYKKAKALADPFAYETYIEQRKQEKLDAERRNRITMKRKLPKVKVNQDLAERILENEEAENEKKDNDGNESKKTSKRKKNALSTEIFKDDRFTQMFENEGKKRKMREEKYDREEDEEVEVEEKESAKRGSIEKPQGEAPDEEEEEDESGAHELVGIPIAPSDQNTKKAGVIFVLEKASLEVAKVGKSFQLLNSDDHANFLRKNKKNPADYRPDIAHQALLAILDSPVNKAGRLQAVYVKTEKGVLFEVKPHVRIPRTYKRFSGIILQLLQQHKITAVGKRESLLRLIKNPATQYFPVNSRKIGFSYSSEKLVKMSKYVDAVGDDVNLVFVVGAMAHGKIETEYVDDFIAISGYPLSAAMCIARITEALAEKWNIL